MEEVPEFLKIKKKRGLFNIFIGPKKSIYPNLFRF